MKPGNTQKKRPFKKRREKDSPHRSRQNPPPHVFLFDAWPNGWCSPRPAALRAAPPPRSAASAPPRGPGAGPRAADGSTARRHGSAAGPGAQGPCDGTGELQTTWWTSEEQQFSSFSSSVVGLQPLSHKQKCKMVPNDNHDYACFPRQDKLSGPWFLWLTFGCGSKLNRGGKPQVLVHGST